MKPSTFLTPHLPLFPPRASEVSSSLYRIFHSSIHPCSRQRSSYHRHHLFMDRAHLSASIKNLREGILEASRTGKFINASEEQKMMNPGRCVDPLLELSKIPAAQRFSRSPEIQHSAPATPPPSEWTASPPSSSSARSSFSKDFVKKRRIGEKHGKGRSAVVPSEWQNSSASVGNDQSGDDVDEDGHGFSDLNLCDSTTPVGLMTSLSGVGEGVEFESLRSAPRWQDLTNQEIQRMKELRERRIALDRRVTWMKNNLMSRTPDEQSHQKVEKEFQQKMQIQKDNNFKMYPPPFLQSQDEDQEIIQLEVEQRKLEVADQMRMKIREEKKRRSAIAKEKKPYVTGGERDPRIVHRERRTLRVGRLLHAAMEQSIHCATPSFFRSVLPPKAKITVHHVSQRTPRSTVWVHYDILSDHNPEEVQGMLARSVSKFRNQLAIRLQLGRTPEVAFVRHDDGQAQSKHRLQHLAQQATMKHQDVQKKSNQSAHVQAVFERVFNHFRN